MLRAVLVIDDYNEMLYLQTFLRKMGIDVESLQNSKKLKEIALGFNPKLIIMTAKGKAVDGLSIAATIQRRSGFPKICLLKSSGVSLSPADLETAAIDRTIDSPVNLKTLIKVIAELGDLKEDLLLEKFAKLQATDQIKTQDGQGTAPQFQLHKPEAHYEKFVTGNGERDEKYKKFVKSMPPQKIKAYPRERIQQFMKELHKTPLPADHAEVEAERLDFVRHLFRKAKG